MNNTGKRLALAQEAVELIKEFWTESEIIGVEKIFEITISDDGRTIAVHDEYDGEHKRKLTEISKELQDEMEGHAIFGSAHYEALQMAMEDLSSDYKKMKKDEFVIHAGNLIYMEQRCEEIYVRLKEICKEAAGLE